MMEAAPYAMTPANSRGRVHSEPEHPYRSPFQRDRDRVIHAAAFRRLEYKTQVFVAGEGGEYRTRLTHTLEVTQIARVLARALGLDEDLAEAIALAHDLGHPPFGHAGEREMNSLMSAHGGFNHNVHGLRVVDVLERRYAAFPGLNLTYEVREAFLRHHEGDPDPGGNFASGEGPLFESQVTVLADEIAYDNHDLDDGLQSGLLDEDELRTLPLWRRAVRAAGPDYDALSPDLRRAEAVRRLINLLADDAVRHTRWTLANLGINSLDAVRRAKRWAVGLSPEIAAEKREMESFLRTRLYRHPKVIEQTEGAAALLRRLFGHYVVKPGELPSGVRARIPEDGVYRAVADHVASLTDHDVRREAARRLISD